MHPHPTSNAQGLSFRQAEHRLFPQVPTALHLKAHGLLGMKAPGTFGANSWTSRQSCLVSSLLGILDGRVGVPDS